mmetsp:Transcript_24964/g.69621  ORF Transcript_24964/g.69621 Transcript_24964/m.69621 type:complete len:366 (+) Transcript_24964:323-1420(+)|eukprot:CAMPEP_0117656424 /NCGR_PEP_ID=MMETSP0804-20121206/4797_1 /TAXON_ID=1074897 /ORGANISM="Tetraselmis astigmatica, Strain CCMP880" /LENGTH=365 /DNA_ID=CAMNT_0005462825 /DNA_START=311 /DNA_END=1408 /DNA_ORIENTATION=+
MPGSTAAKSADAGIGKTVMVCLDVHPEASQRTVRFAMRELVKAGDTIRIATVLPLGANSTTDDAMDSAYGWSGQSWKKEREKNTAVAMEAMHNAIKLVKSYEVDVQVLDCLLEPQGGASGIGASLTNYAEQHAVDIVVVGSRGYGTFRRGVMTLAGLGSVSNHCMNNLHCPIICVKQDIPSTEQNSEEDLKPGARLCLAVDNTDHSHRMVQWAASTFVKPHTKVHVISVCHTSLDHTFQNQGAVALLDPSPPIPPAEDAFQPEVHQVLAREAHRAISSTIATLKARGVIEGNIFSKVLEPEGGASDVGLSIVNYVNKYKFNVTVIGNRCESGFQKFMSNVLLHHGSVSNECVQKVEGPVAVFKYK